MGRNPSHLGRNPQALYYGFSAAVAIVFLLLLLLLFVAMPLSKVLETQHSRIQETETPDFPQAGAAPDSSQYTPAGNDRSLLDGQIKKPRALGPNICFPLAPETWKRGISSLDSNFRIIRWAPLLCLQQWGLSVPKLAPCLEGDAAFPHVNPLNPHFHSGKQWLPQSNPL